MVAAAPYAVQAGGVRLFVRLTPGARQDGIEGLRPRADGGTELSVKLRAVPEKGKANAALIRFLADELGLAVSALEIAAGTTSRHKQVVLQGAAADLSARLNACLAPFAAVKGD